MCILGQGEGSVPDSGRRPEVISHQPTLMWGLPCQQGSHDHNDNTRDEVNEERSKRTGDKMDTEGHGMKEG